MPDEAPDALGRFVAAQAGVWQQVVAELGAGRKTSHWMWFVFPQLRGLGSSEMAQRYGIASLAEATAYRAHPLLGPRLLHCTQLVLAVGGGRSAHAIFGAPDDLKFRSCMTLFAAAAGPDDAPFRAALQRFFGGVADDATLGLLKRPGSACQP